jgi:hypothetical protein
VTHDSVLTFYCFKFSIFEEVTVSLHLRSIDSFCQARVTASNSFSRYFYRSCIAIENPLVEIQVDFVPYESGAPIIT